MLRKEKFSSALSKYGMSNAIFKSKLSQKSVHFCMITLHARDFILSNFRKGDSSIIAVPIKWYFESECHSAPRKCCKSVSKESLRLFSSTPCFTPVPLYSSTSLDTMISIYPRVAEEESLDFESSPRVYPSAQAYISTVGKSSRDLSTNK